MNSIRRIKTNEHKNDLSDPWSNQYYLFPKRISFLNDCQGMYFLHHAHCKKLWGKPNWIFNGEHRYHCYTFKATYNTKSIDFVVFSDGETTGQGSTFELYGDLPNQELIIFIAKWLHKKGKSNMLKKQH